MFITALDDLESKRKGFYSGVDDYMVKPVDMDEMAAYVNGEEVPILPREFNVLSEVKENVVCVTVRDSGCGMDKETAESKSPDFIFH